MSTLLLFLLSSIGFTAVMVESEVGEFIKSQLLCLSNKINFSWLSDKIEKVFNCHRCMGVWSGWICGFCVLPWEVGTLLMAGFAGSCASVFSAFLINYLEANSIVEYRENHE